MTIRIAPLLLSALLSAVPAATVLAAAEPAAAKAATTAPAAAGEAQAWKYQVPHLDRARLDALLAHPDRLLVLDVRRPDELVSKGRFPVFLNIQNAELEQSLAFVPKDRTIVTVSNHAGRAGAAGDLLRAKGYQVAGAIGVENYLQEGGRWAQGPDLAGVAAAAPAAAKAAGATR